MPSSDVTRASGNRSGSRKAAGQLNKPGWSWPGWKPFWSNNRQSTQEKGHSNVAFFDVKLLLLRHLQELAYFAYRRRSLTLPLCHNGYMSRRERGAPFPHRGKGRGKY